MLGNKKLTASTCKLRALATNQPHKIGEDQFKLIDHIMTNLDGRMLTEFECPNDGNVITDYTRLLPNYTSGGSIEFMDIQNKQSTSDHIPLVAIVNGPVGFPVTVMQMNLLANLLSGDGFLKGSLPLEKSETVKNALVEFKQELENKYPTTEERKALGRDTGTWTHVKNEILEGLNVGGDIRNTIEEHSLTKAMMNAVEFKTRANVLIPSILSIQPDIIAFQENDMEPQFHVHEEFSKVYTNSFEQDHAHLEKREQDQHGKRTNKDNEDLLGTYFVGDGVSIYVRKERFQIVYLNKLFTSEGSPILHVQVTGVDGAVYDVITTHLSSGDNDTDKGKRTNDLTDLETYIQKLGEERNIILMMDANEDVRTRRFMK